MDQTGVVGIAAALRRVVVGFRVVSALWVAALAAVALPGESRQTRLLLGAVVAAAGLWAVVTVVASARRPRLFASVAFVVADIVVAAGVAAAAGLAGSTPLISGAYPFSAVLLASYNRGAAGGAAAAVVLTAVAVGLDDAAGAVTTAFVHGAGAAVVVWGIALIREADRRQRELAAELADERAAVARALERAEAADALHDSVLQTLALVQRRRDDPEAVTALARRGERELRRWIAGDAPPASFAGAVESMAADVEETYGLAVEVVCVGDRPADEATTAVVAAAREALTNVAKHAGTLSAVLFAEAEGDTVTVTVRDRGCGFDPAAVPPDRHGLAESIIGRVRRHGGTATVRSAPGAGTEIELVLRGMSRA